MGYRDVTGNVERGVLQCSFQRPIPYILPWCAAMALQDRGRGRPDVHSQMWLFRSIWPGLSSPWGWSEEQKFRPHTAHGKQISSRYVCVSL